MSRELNTRTVFSGDTGYRGLVAIATNGYVDLSNIGNIANNGIPEGMTILLATSGQFTQTHNPIFSSGDWGAGYMNISERVAYANNIIRVEGSMGFEVTAGQGFTAMKNFAFVNRGTSDGTSMIIFPNGETGFSGVGWATSLSFSMSQDAILTADMNWSSFIDGVTNKITTGSNSNSKFGALGESDGKPARDLPFAFNALYPYWGSKVIGASGNPYQNIMSWQAGYDSSIEMLKCCGTLDDDNNKPTLISHKVTVGGREYEVNPGPVAPDYLGLGPMNATCSWEIFTLTGEFDYNMFHAEREAKFIITTPFDAQGSKLPGDNAPNSHSILLPKIVCDSNSSQVQTGNGWITASFNYSAIGDGKGAPMDIDRDKDDSSDSSDSSNSN